MNRGYAFKQLVLARLREFFREPVAIFWVYGFPLLLALILGLAFSNANVAPPTVDVIVRGTRLFPDDDKTRSGIVRILKDADIDVHEVDEADAEKRLRQGKSAMTVDLRAEPIAYVYDPTRPDGVHAKYWVDAVLTRGMATDAPRVEDKKVTARGSRYIDFLLPGLVGINIMGGGLFGVGFAIVEMRVRKLFKRLMATPIHRGDFLLSMLSSRLLLLTPEMISLLGVARWFADVPVFGSWGTLIVVVITGALAFAGIGLLLGCRAEKMETISGLLNLVLLPSYMLSGVFFSAGRFPEFLQPLVQALPLTRLNNALREVMLEGAGLADISGHLLVLAAWGVVCFAVALRWFKWT
jgi:ABC-2 type transport system permease protein